MFFNIFVVKQTIALIEICDKLSLSFSTMQIIFTRSYLYLLCIETPMGTYIFLHQSCQHNSRNFSNENKEYDDCILYRVKNISLYHKWNTRKYMKRSIYKRSLIYTCILIRYRMLNMPERYFTLSFHVS